ncbi:hypothetical protein S40288_09830 [Stachybotrys chartarum IBT 40288]|nr:hypothetical protein S40288_09830 [Stachybotrys chartarum IBT 40288]
MAARFMRHVSAIIRGNRTSRLDTNSRDMKIFSGSDHKYEKPPFYNDIDTIGSAVTVLAPCITARVLCELNEAKRETEKRMATGAADSESRDRTMMAQYGQEIFDYMREMEIKMLPNPHYMDDQTDIQWSMRSDLIDWLVQVHARFRLRPETLFLTVNYMDRFLGCRAVSREKLQLVGAAALLIASKFGDVKYPSPHAIFRVMDEAYDMEDILKAERFMLGTLNFELGWPDPLGFLRRISKADNYDLETEKMAKYFLEVTIMDQRFVASPPSFLAAGAHCLSRLLLNKGNWTKAHIHYSGYTWSQLGPLVRIMMECCEQPRFHHPAIFEKYSKRRLQKESTIAQRVQRTLDAGFFFPQCLDPVQSTRRVDLEPIHESKLVALSLQNSSSIGTSALLGDGRFRRSLVGKLADGLMRWRGRVLTTPSLCKGDEQ